MKKRIMNINRQVSVDVPLVPNFIKIAGQVVDVADLADDEIRQIAEVWKENFFENAKLRRGLPRNYAKED